MIHLIILTLVDTKEKCAFVIENIRRIYVYAYRNDYGYRFTDAFCRTLNTKIYEQERQQRRTSSTWQFQD